MRSRRIGCLILQDSTWVGICLLLSDSALGEPLKFCQFLIRSLLGFPGCASLIRLSRFSRLLQSPLNL
jgi:hypothetical protein